MVIFGESCNRMYFNGFLLGFFGIGIALYIGNWFVNTIICIKGVIINLVLKGWLER